MTIEEEFTKWFDEQVENGLVDFKLDVRSAPKGSTKEEVMSEILECERLIAAGEVEVFPPEPDLECHRGAQYIIGSCIFGTPIDQEHLDHLMKMEKLGYTKEYCDY